MCRSGLVRIIKIILYIGRNAGHVGRINLAQWQLCRNPYRHRVLTEHAQSLVVLDKWLAGD
mgnify:CR=1 FL=1